MAKNDDLTLKFFLDTEFNDEVGNCRMELISLAFVSEDGEREFYAESAEFEESAAHPWLRQNVLPKLGDRAQRLPLDSIVSGLKTYLADAVRAAPGRVTRVQIWAKNGAMDQAVIGLIFGGLARYYAFMTEQGVERNYFRDTNELRLRTNVRVATENRPVAQQHHALWDARNERQEYLALCKALTERKIVIPE